MGALIDALATPADGTDRATAFAALKILSRERIGLVAFQSAKVGCTLARTVSEHSVLISRLPSARVCLLQAVDTMISYLTDATAAPVRGEAVRALINAIHGAREAQERALAAGVVPALLALLPVCSHLKMPAFIAVLTVDSPSIPYVGR